MEGGEKKKNNLGIIILIIILVVGSLVGGYFIGANGLISTNKKSNDEVNDKNTNKDKEKEKEKEKEPVVTEYDVTDEKVAKLIPNLVEGGFGCDAIEEFISDGKVISNDIRGVRAFIMVQRNFKKDEVTLDEYTKEVQKYLGKDYNFNPDTIDYNGFYCPLYKYDSITKKFVKQETACGGECGPHTLYKIVKAVDTDGTLVLDVKVIFSKFGSANLYADYNRTKSLGYFDKLDFNTVFDSGSTYKFTFKLEDSNYVFVSSELVK